LCANKVSINPIIQSRTTSIGTNTRDNIYIQYIYIYIILSKAGPTLNTINQFMYKMCRLFKFGLMYKVKAKLSL
jgi:hypothetical protein